VFVDVGSGAGRVVLVAALFFRCARVVGLERDPKYDSLARRNLDRMRPRPKTPVEFVHDDVVVWDVPDDASVVFFNNVFTGDLFRTLVEKIIASVDRAPRKVTFLYGNPQAADVLAEYPRFVLVDEIRSWRPKAEWAKECSVSVYEVA
jgi:predicted RNA methylase